jgi:hypothetical protein
MRYAGCMTVATDQLLCAGKGAELIRAKTGRNCSRQNLDKLVKQGKLPRSTASASPVRVRADLLVEEYLDSIDQRQAVRDKPGVKAEPVIAAPPAAIRPAPTARAEEPLSDDELPAYTISQQRKAFEQANLLELERKQKEGQLVERESVVSTWAQLINSAKTKLLAVPTTLRQRIPHLTAEEGEVIDVVIRAALADLTDEAGCSVSQA